MQNKRGNGPVMQPVPGDKLHAEVIRVVLRPGMVFLEDLSDPVGCDLGIDLRG